MLTALLLAAAAPETPFPERMPALMEACLHDAVAIAMVSQTEDSHKYICTGDAAQRMWDFLERARVPSYEQDVVEGRWLSRGFPLGGCFKRLRHPDGSKATDGLSCSIWIPRRAAVPDAAAPAPSD